MRELFWRQMGQKEKSQRKWYRDFEFQGKIGIVWEENKKKGRKEWERGKVFLIGEGESWENKKRQEMEKDSGESENKA